MQQQSTLILNLLACQTHQNELLFLRLFKEVPTTHNMLFVQNLST